MTPKQQAKKLIAEKIIEKMEKRNFEASYVQTKEEALEKVKAFLKKGASVTWGGSESLAEIGFHDFIKDNPDYIVLDRMKAKANGTMKEFFKEAYVADYFLMSSNAITMDGELVNIDGNANRVSLLCYGPENVIIVAGMNKIADNVEDAVKRIKREACPANTIRLGCKTPCAMTGICGDCLSPDCICVQTVITRFSKIPGRIKVILVGEELGF